jgi:hypothetical protein
MEGKRKGNRLRIRRRYEAHRLEDQLWTVAYEQLWPLLRATVRTCPTTRRDAPQVSPAPARLARRA